MTSDNRSSREIEREIEQERADLKGTLGDLQNSFSAGNVMDQVSAQFREHGGDLGRSVGNAVKSNPLALALTGVGLIWLISGDKSGAPARIGRYDDDRFREGSRHAALGHRTDPPAGPRDTVPQGPMPEWAIEDEDETPGLRDRVGSAAGSARDRASSAGRSVGDTARGARDSAGRRYEAARQGVHERTEAGRQRLAAMRERLSRGTENMSEEGRQRVIAARERAIEARDRTGVAMRRGGDRAADFYDEHPLVVGALALAVGAAIAGAMPRSRVEDQYLGEHRDALFDEAERIYGEEKAKVQHVADAAAGEAQTIARETKDKADAQARPGQTGADTVTEKAREAGERVAKAAKDEADKENLGKRSGN